MTEEVTPTIETEEVTPNVEAKPDPDPLFPKLFCKECGIQITRADHPNSWAELVDFKAQNGWIYHHIACKPMPADRMVRDVPSHAEVPVEPKLIKPAAKRSAKKAPAKKRVAK